MRIDTYIPTTDETPAKGWLPVIVQWQLYPGTHRHTRRLNWSIIEQRFANTSDLQRWMKGPLADVFIEAARQLRAVEFRTANRAEVFARGTDPWAELDRRHAADGDNEHWRL